MSEIVVSQVKQVFQTARAKYTEVLAGAADANAGTYHIIREVFTLHHLTVWLKMLKRSDY